MCCVSAFASWILWPPRAQLQCGESRNGCWRSPADSAHFLSGFSIAFSLKKLSKSMVGLPHIQAGLEFLPCLLSHSQLLSLSSKIVFEFGKNFIKLIMENDGEETHVLPDFLSASTTSVKSSGNCSYAQLLFSKDHFIFWNY